MLTEFMGEWFDEHVRWTGNVLKVAAAEGPENKALIAQLEDDLANLRARGEQLAAEAPQGSAFMRAIRGEAASPRKPKGMNARDTAIAEARAIARAASAGAVRAPA